MLHERKSRLMEGQAALSSPEPDLARIRGRAARVGAELRAARLQYGWELEAVAASLRIRGAYLEALEAGRVADLPGNAYALGFLRAYASVLGLDADEMSRRFRAEVAEVNAKTELTFPAPVPERGVPAGAVILLGVALAIGAYIGWYRLTEHGAPAGGVPPVPPKLAHLAEPTVLAPKPVPTPAAKAATSVAQPAVTPEVTFATHPVAPSPGPATPAAVPAATTPAPAPRPAAEVAMPLATGPAEAGSTTEAARTTSVSPPGAAATAATGSSSAAATGAAATGAAATGAAATRGATTGGATTGAAPPSALTAVAALAPPAQAAPVPPEAPGTIIVRALTESWVEVRDATGAIVFMKLMQPGESWTAPREPGLTLTTGNAGGTQLVVDGKVAASLGTAGEVERNQPLDPGLIQAGALPAQIAAAAAPQGAHSNLGVSQ